ncbi:G patch domain-containing protein 3 isoform X2 [Hemicordylus capensis]|uniref:G patch domain-containing protein 3 isoform X2 n=1 Tax=Hemicordylus capensis TaxID=884348 RepID=UPI0023035619|nr:G patch domain-containing protein 3 isoform X2 [Hemicordylus capensis]
MAASTSGSSSLQPGGRYCLVSCIPRQLRSADLRSYFSQFVEDSGFLCFHYRHRPERGEGPDVPSHPSSTCCCLVEVRSGWSPRFVRMYSGKCWIDSRGETLPGRCLIRRVRVSPDTGVDTFPYKTKKELQKKASHEIFTQNDFKQLPELNPPVFMPYGNVGTPLRVFLDLIRACRMPARAIKKLQLQFPTTGSSRRYGNVPFTYEETETVVEEERVYTATGEEITREHQPRVQVVYQDNDKEEGDREDSEKDLAEEYHMSDEDDDDRCEEWERHEALHEDITSQERTKERLYEEEIELKWEKGGSGLVFYTDAQYWHEEEEGDFDEQTADDWDVDMSIYYDKDGGDKDARDLVQMRFEQRLREGLEDGSVLGQQIGNFEKYTKVPWREAPDFCQAQETSQGCPWPDLHHLR